VRSFEDVDSLANRTPVASGTLEAAGYYTIDFDQTIEVAEGSQFAIVLYIKSPGADHPMAIEYQSDRLVGDIDLSDGTGYISKNGLDWDSVEEMSGGNLCLKVYADRVEDEP